MRTILLLAAPAMLLAGCQTVTEVLSGIEKPSARVEGVDIAALDLDGADLSFDIAIANPYAAALPLTDLRYALSSEGRSIVSGAAPLEGSIPARGERTITIPASVRFADLFEALRDVRPGAIVPYEAELDLVVDVPRVAGVEPGRFSIPLRHRDELPVPAVPDVSIDRIQWQEFTLDRASAIVHLEVANTNSFPFDLRSLSYALSLAGRDVGSALVAQALALEPGEAGGIEIPISVSPLSLGQAAMDVLRGSRAEYAIGGEIEADTPYGLLRLPFEKVGEARMRRE